MSDVQNRLKNEMIQRFGEAYKAFGLNKLMGHIVALLIFSPTPLSLDEICEHLGRSKGPVSQIVRRLKDKKLIRKVWQPENNRKDFYEIEPEIFEHAFLNNLSLIKNNTKIALNLKDIASQDNGEGNGTIKVRLDEMLEFYILMEKHYNNFLEEWKIKRAELTEV